MIPHSDMNFEDDIVSCIKILENGGIILYPTDTIWGIGCDATNDEAVDRIFALKKRPDQKSMITLVADEKDVLRYVASPDLQVFNYLATTIKPTTVIFDNSIGLSDRLTGTDGSIAIRICRDEFCRHLIKRFRKPIVSTSANISGEPAPHNFRQITDAVKNGVDYVVRYRQDETAISQPSAIVKWNKDRIETIRS